LQEILLSGATTISARLGVAVTAIAHDGERVSTS
jgi:hypothetical protein